MSYYTDELSLVGKCCFCGGECNPCSQCCGRCIRIPIKNILKDEKEEFINDVKFIIKKLDKLLAEHPEEDNKFFTRGIKQLRLAKLNLNKSLK
jgi:hypothetical protein